MLLTFTNKAAAEMVARISSLFGQEVATKIEAGTFHAVSYRWLKKKNQKIVLKQPNELKTLFKSVHEKRRFYHIECETKPYSAQGLYDVYSLFQNTHHGIEFADWVLEHKDEHGEFADIYSDICNEFEDLKRDYGFVHFNDLLIKMKELLQETKMPYKEVLIDEYQDTNTLQGSLIEAMNPPSLFCVGDYDQSIYGFNGSDISIIGSFATKFENAKVFTLSKNYRSTEPILSLANKVIAHNKRIYPKELEVVRGGLATPPKLFIYDELFDQYKAIAKRIKDSSNSTDDIAVIFRNNASADGVEATLREENIASRRKGGHSFFDAREVKVLLDIYVLMVNPNDMMAFIHIMEYAKGVGSAIAKELFEALKKLGRGSVIEGFLHPDDSIRDPFIKKDQNYQLGLFDDWIELGSMSRFAGLNFEEKFLSNTVLKHPKLNAESGEFLYHFYNLIKKLKRISVPLHMIEAILESKLFNEITDSLARKRGTLKNGEVDATLEAEAKERIERKGVLLKDLARPYDEHERFVNAMVLGSNELSKGEGVHLLTVHASKGLEFKEVYLVDLMDGRFPNRKLVGKGGGSIDEERRLFYVAATRAKDLLYLNFAKYDKIRKTEFVPSLFLYEAGLIKKDSNYDKMMALG